MATGTGTVKRFNAETGFGFIEQDGAAPTCSPAAPRRTSFIGLQGQSARVVPWNCAATPRTDARIGPYGRRPVRRNDGKVQAPPPMDVSDRQAVARSLPRASASRISASASLRRSRTYSRCVL